ncbi:MAG: hypothetical protein KatS3mg105_0450 [Gemmatales bacterium]|nr:MAG: hypothetical protein KatS3mg105_0450 [Gemmatales bacterium]
MSRRSILFVFFVVTCSNVFGEEKRVAVGKCLSPTGMIVRREKGNAAWQVVRIAEPIFTEDLLLALPLGVLRFDNDMRMSFLADMDGRSPFPAIDSAVRIHANKEVDLDFTLDRGRVAFSNVKKRGAAKVLVRFHDQVWAVNLKEPNTRVAVEIYGRCPRGAIFSRDGKNSHSPVFDAVVIVMTGRAAVRIGNEEHLLHPPPKLCFLHWDSIDGAETPRRLPKLPDWSEPDDLGKLKVGLKFRQKIQRLQQFRKLVVGQSVSAAVETFLESNDPAKRRFAVYAAAAADDLRHLTQALNQPKDTDLCEDAVRAVRHWLGRAPGQDLRLYRHLTTAEKFKPSHAETIVQLAHSFAAEDIRQPATYELLTAYLRHDVTAIRVLAYWHLYRLVPKGRDIKYDPLGDKETIEAGYKAWKKLIPDGQLPPT